MRDGWLADLPTHSHELAGLEVPALTAYVLLSRCNLAFRPATHPTTPGTTLDCDGEENANTREVARITFPPLCTHYPEPHQDLAIDTEVDLEPHNLPASQPHPSTKTADSALPCPPYYWSLTQTSTVAHYDNLCVCAGASLLSLLVMRCFGTFSTHRLLPYCASMPSSCTATLRRFILETEWHYMLLGL
jgi:hypothetical protein